MEEEKIKKNNFDMLKWDLFRLKCEQIDIDYAEFKKRQKKIRWWNEIIQEWKCIRRSQKNYDEHKL